MTKEQFLTLKAGEYMIIDIREADELNEFPSPTGAIHIPMSKVIEQAGNNSLPKDKKILTVCRSGGRTRMLNDFLGKRGYQVDYLEGGVLDLNGAL